MVAATAPFWVPVLGFVVFNVVTQPFVRRWERRHYESRH